MNTRLGRLSDTLIRAFLIALILSFASSLLGNFTTRFGLSEYANVVLTDYQFKFLSTEWFWRRALIVMLTIALMRDYWDTKKGSLLTGTVASLSVFCWGILIVPISLSNVGITIDYWDSLKVNSFWVLSRIPVYSITFLLCACVWSIPWKKECLCYHK